MAVATGVYRTTYRADMSLRRTKAEYARLALMVIVLGGAPFYLSNSWLFVANVAGISVIAAVGLNVATGYTGLISMATGGFLAVGGYTTAIAVTRWGLPTPLAWMVATALAAAVGALFGLPAGRLKGIYLAITTLAAQYIIVYLVRSWKAVTGGLDSLIVKPPQVRDTLITQIPEKWFGVVGKSEHFAWYWVILFFATLAVLGTINLFRTGLGRALIAIRDQDIAAEVIGVRVARYKVLAFAISAGMAGFAGALQASYRGIVTFERYTVDVSIVYVTMIIIGGLGSVSGAVYGALFITWLPEYIRHVGSGIRSGSAFGFITEHVVPIQNATFAIVLVLFLLVEPRGMARLWQRAKDYFRLWPFRY
jgi:branched-chain amino acid transport system permease protein